MIDETGEKKVFTEPNSGDSTNTTSPESAEPRKVNPIPKTKKEETHQEQMKIEIDDEDVDELKSEDKMENMKDNSKKEKTETK